MLTFFSLYGSLTVICSSSLALTRGQINWVDGREAKGRLFENARLASAPERCYYANGAIESSMNTVSESQASNDQFRLCGTKFLISAQDMRRAIQFYRDTIGLEVTLSSPYWSELCFGTAVIALHGGGTGEFRATGLSFTVDDIHHACKAVFEGGGTVRSGPEDRGDEGIYLAELTDTEGNGFMMSQDKH